MNTPESGSEVAEQIAALRRLVFTLLLALIVVSGTLTVYLYRQQKLLRTDIANVRPQALQIITTFKQNQPNLEHLIGQLVAYGNTHPDYQKTVLAHYPFLQPQPAGK